MSTRLVVGKVSRTDGLPWQNVKVTFRRSLGNYTPTSQFPPDTIVAHTNQDGDLYSVMGNILVSGVYLWCNTDGASYTPYECSLPNDSFVFQLPVGNFPITLSELREGSGEATEPQNQTILEYIDSRIASVQLGSTQVFSNEFIATTNLSALRVVNLKTGTYASSLEINDTTGVFGVTTNSIAQGTSGKALIFGELFDNNFNLLDGNIYLGNVGLLTQNLIGNELFILNIGTTINNKKILVDIKEVIRCI